MTTISKITGNNSQNQPLNKVVNESNSTHIGKVSVIKAYADTILKIIDLWVTCKLTDDKASAKIFSKQMKIEIIHLSKITASSEKILFLDNKISHLKEDIYQIVIKKKLGDKLEVHSRNMIKSDLFAKEKNSLVGPDGSLDKIINDNFKDKFVASKSAKKFTSQLSNVKEAVKDGVCAGACVDFAEKLLNGSPIDQSRIVSVAENFQRGVTADAVANQIAYQLAVNGANQIAQKILNEQKNFFKENFETASQSFEEAEKMGLINKLQLQELKLLLEMTAKMNKSTETTLDQLIKYGDKVENKEKAFYNFVIGICRMKIEGNLNPINMQNAMENARGQPQAKESNTVNLELKMNLFGDALLRMIELSQRNVEVLDDKSSEGNTALFNTTLKNNIEGSQVLSNKIQVRDAHKPSISSEMAKVASLRRLNTSNNLFDDVDRCQNDSRILQNINDFQDGVYYMGFATGEGRHATLLIKTKEGFNFWDPNYGLIKCDKDNPKETILTILKDYYKEPKTPLQGREEGMNHQIVIKQFTKKET